MANKMTSDFLNGVKKLAPAFIKNSIRNTINERNLSRALNEIRRLPGGEVPSVDLLETLQAAWNNEGMAAQTGYLQEVSRIALNVQGAVLECGSGLTTLLLGLLAGRRGNTILTLEHHAEWHQKVSSVLRRYDISGVQNCLTPIHSFGDFSWYESPSEPIPQTFSLVVCDGPPGDTPGGRYGLLPRMNDYIPPGALILLDDAHRPEESEAIRRWELIRSLDVTFHSQGRGAYAVIKVGEARNTT